MQKPLSSSRIKNETRLTANTNTT